MRRFPPARRLAVLTLGFAVVVTAGCGSGSSGGAPEPAAPAPAATATATATATAGDCADAQPEIDAATQVTGFVTGVEVASCDLATVTTTLGTTADDVVSATGICSNAANEAAGHGVAAVSIVAADGTELATGTDATDCAGAMQP